MGATVAGGGACAEGGARQGEGDARCRGEARRVQETSMASKPSTGRRTRGSSASCTSSPPVVRKPRKRCRRPLLGSGLAGTKSAATRRSRHGCGAWRSTSPSAAGVVRHARATTSRGHCCGGRSHGIGRRGAPRAAQDPHPPAISAVPPPRRRSVRRGGRRRDVEQARDREVVAEPRPGFARRSPRQSPGLTGSLGKQRNDSHGN